MFPSGMSCEFWTPKRGSPAVCSACCVDDVADVDQPIGDLHASGMGARSTPAVCPLLAALGSFVAVA
eukprot:12868828-Prorocentrum_lima.AAC.1